MKCLRCHEWKDVVQFGEVKVCDSCIELIVKEWEIKTQEAEELLSLS